MPERINRVAASNASTDGARAASRARRIVTSMAAGLLVAQLALPADAADAADAFGIEQLMRSFARMKSSRADFVERKYLNSLDRPLDSSGELVYVAPSRLERRTIKPKPEDMVVDGNTLTIERGGKKRTVSLSSYPEAAAFTDSIRSTLAGDLDALRRDYRVILDGTAALWQLTLLPSDPKLAALVSRVQLTGRGDRIEGIEILQADGNRSVATITPKP